MSAVEYGLMLAAIAAVLVATVFAVGQITALAFTRECTGLNIRISGTATCPAR